MPSAVLYSPLFYSTRTDFSFTRYYHMRLQLINPLIEYICICIYTQTTVIPLVWVQSFVQAWTTKILKITYLVNKLFLS